MQIKVGLQRDIDLGVEVEVLAHTGSTSQQTQQVNSGTRVMVDYGLAHSSRHVGSAL